jgi:hypothetical protein
VRVFLSNIHTCAPMDAVLLYRTLSIIIHIKPVSNACIDVLRSGYINTTFNNGSLGFRIDEERRESAKRNVNCRIQ